MMMPSLFTENLFDDFFNDFDEDSLERKIHYMENMQEI